MSRRPLIETAHGSRREAFGPQEWGLLASIAAMWGSSFLFIEIGLEGFGPGLVAFGRVAIGALTLSLVPGSRRPVDRADLPRVALLGVVWMAAPLVLFPIGQQWIDSSLAGMINGAVPVFAALTAAALGFFGTGWAFVAMTTLVGRVGATRGSVAIYFLPVVAIALGVVFRGETVAAISLVGTALVLLGAYLTSRREERPDEPPGGASTRSTTGAGR